MNLLPKFIDQPASVPAGQLSDIEMCRHLAKLIRQLLFAYILAEIEAMDGDNSVEVAEGDNVAVHNAAIEKLKSIADEMNPPVVKLGLLSPKLSSLPYLLPALMRPFQ